HARQGSLEQADAAWHIAPDCCRRRPNRTHSASANELSSGLFRAHPKGMFRRGGKRMLRVLGVLAVVAAAFLSTEAAAQTSPGAWVVLHTERIALASGRQRLQVANAPTTKAIRLQVTDGQLELSRVVINYANGQVHFEPRPLQLTAGTQSRPIGDRDEALVVDTVTLEYRPQPSAPPVTLQALGLSSGIG